MYSTMCSHQGEEKTATYAAASLAGVERLAELAAEDGMDCDLERRPAFTYAAESKEISSVQQELEAARQAGLPVECVDGPDLPFTTHGAVRLDDQVQIQPVRYVQGLAAAVDG